MNHWQKIALPAALGLCAAALNWQSINSKLTPHVYASLTKNVQAGQTFCESEKEVDALFTPVYLRHDGSESLDASLIPWDMRHQLVGRFSERDIKANTLLTRFDLREMNIADPKDEITILVEMDQDTRKGMGLYVNDLVDVTYPDEEEFKQCRILSIRNKEKGGCQLTVGVSKMQRAKNKKLPTGKPSITGHAPNVSPK